MNQYIDSLLIFHLEKSGELIDSAKSTANDVSAKEQELEQSAEQKLASAENTGKKNLIIFHDNTYYSCMQLGEQQIEESKEAINEKGSSIKAKGAEIFGATQHALATGANIITEKAKQGIELASTTASNVKAATEQLAGDAQTKVVETAHNAQGL